MGQALLGTMTFGDTVDLDTARAMVDTALDLGIDHIDTANVYTAGEAERMLGEAARRGVVTRSRSPRRSACRTRMPVPTLRCRRSRSCAVSMRV